jgi:ribonuclease BN (tRNA processing enzyme)
VRDRRLAAPLLLAAGLAMGCKAAAPGPPAKRASESARMTVVLLGTGMPAPDPDAWGPATAVVLEGKTFLFDAGVGVERQLAEAKLPVDGVTALFVTHLHSDHTLGYPDLILTSWIKGRSQPLQAYGPHGLRPMTDHLLEAFCEDIEVRSTGLERDPPGGWRVDVHEISPGLVYDRDGVRVTAISVAHGSWKEAYGYRIDAAGRSVVISGDTRPCAALEEAARGVDVLVHEVYSQAHLGPENRPGGEDWPRYMRQFHTSDRELGELAARDRPGLLVLTHIIRMGASDADLLEGVRAGGFTGRVAVGRDLDRFEVH